MKKQLSKVIFTMFIAESVFIVTGFVAGAETVALTEKAARHSRN